MADDIGQLLAAHFPHIPRAWLKYVNDKLGKIKQENGGNVEMSVRWTGGEDQWTDWNQRDLNSAVSRKKINNRV